MEYFNNVPSELLENRNAIEGNFIFCLWKEPEYYDMYDKNIYAITSSTAKDMRPPTFKNKESIFYYIIGQSMYNLGYTEFDEVSISIFLEDKKGLKDLYNDYGGYEAVKSATSVVNTENVDVYFDELAKSNILISLHKKGFNVLDKLDMFKQMSSEQIDDYYDYLLNETMINNASYVEVEDLVVDEKFVRAMEQGVDIGLQYNKTCKILNYITMGIPKGDLFMLGGHSGSGKAQPLYSKILTPSGYVRMGNIEVGIDIYGEDGNVYKVASIHPQGIKDAYRITFNDGASTISCDKHLWTVYSEDMGWETVELKDIINTGNITKFSIPVFKQQDKLRQFSRIEYIGKEEMQCITTTNPTKLYITDDMIVTHNSSFSFANMVIPAVENGHKACIISNEQSIKDFQNMLVAMTLANDFNYYGITRKQIKAWNFNQEQMEMFKKAMEKTKEKYTGRLKFVRMFDYDNAKIKRVVRRLAKQGFELFIYDTFKSEGSADNWAELINDSRDLFQLVSKEDVAMVTTYQLAPAHLHRRFLDVTTLSNAKQIKEVYSEMVYFRPIWEDEFKGEKYDIEPYQMVKVDGKYTGEKKFIELDRSKKYIILFVDKTRNDEDKQTLVYEFNGRFNTWKEVGFCKVHYDRY